MPPIRRSDSEVTHVSDSEPECEAVRREQQESSPLSSRKSFHYSPRAPLTQISNTPKHARIHRRIATIEKELADIKQEVQAGTSDAGTAPGSLKRPGSRSLTPSPSRASAFPSTPPRNKRRCVRSVGVGGDSPVGRLSSPRVHRSSLLLSTPEREQLSREMGCGNEEAFESPFISPLIGLTCRGLKRRVPR
ncbi:hypothetical protein B0H14DRAFT_3006156 [Mycena olivaceomarginata]|nr:hypothetical protein B0H14DRAFT_3006156 [Mycena olivaceomarginata]